MYTELTSIKRSHKGKVADVYPLPDGNVIIVRTDRVSALNDKFSNTIPDKGIVLNKLSKWWMEGLLKDIIPNHLTNLSVADYVSPEELPLILGRAEVFKNLKPIKIEAVVRSHLYGSAYEKYKETGEICGIALPPGLKKGDKLPEIIFTPTIKSEDDPEITFEKMCELVGRDLAEQIRSVSLKIFKLAYDYLYKRGIILADSKFEFGLDEFGNLTLMDEVFTPDSSRFWKRFTFENEGVIVSLDKQKIRDWLQEQRDKGIILPKSIPTLPDWLVIIISGDYKDIFTQITGRKFTLH